MATIAKQTGKKPDDRLEMCADNLQEGQRLGPVFYVVGSDQIKAFASALRSRNPLYLDDDGVAPPTMRLLDYSLLIATHFKGGKGGVHAKHRCDFIEPLRVGQAVRVEGTVTSIQRRRGKFYFTLEYETRDANSNQLLVRQAITSILLSREGAMS